MLFGLGFTSDLDCHRYRFPKDSRRPSSASAHTQVTQPPTIEAEYASALESESSSEANVEASGPAEFANASTDISAGNEDPRWAQIYELMPKSSEVRNDAKCEAFEESEAGHELNRLIDEVLSGESYWEDEY